MKTVFIVDDNATNLSSAKSALQDRYKVRTISSALKMFELLGKITPDLILLDIEMPEMDGFEALGILKGTLSTSDIPVIFLTSLSDPETEIRGFEMGVIDFIAKPFSAPVLQLRVKTHLEIDEIIRDRTSRLLNLQNALVYTLANVIQRHDKETGDQISRTAAYIKVLVGNMMAQGVYLDELNKMDIELLISSARLHDVGKFPVSDQLLGKQAELTGDELALIMAHCDGSDEITSDTNIGATAADFLNVAREVSTSHRERWDGKGFPEGLSGTDIPLHGRIAAIVDVYDALVSDKTNSRAFSPDQAMNIIMSGSGTQFDPSIAEVFFKAKSQIASIISEN